MEPTNTPIQRFFADHARSTESGDVPAITACYADTFLAAGPRGAKPVHSSDFALALPKRYQLMESLGCRSTELIELHEDWLDRQHVSVRTAWRLRFERPDKETLPIVVESTFLVDAGREPFRILAYLAHSDLMEVLKQHGIAPG